MEKIRNRRVMAIILVIAVIFAFSVTPTISFASDNVESDVEMLVNNLEKKEISDLDSVEYDGIIETAELLEEIGGEVKDISTDVEENNVVMDTEIEGIDETIVVNEALEAGDINLDIYEDGKFDNVVLTDAGEVFINGEKIESYYDEDIVTADWQNYSANATYGSNSSYTYAKSSKTVDKTYPVKLAKNIAKHTVSALCFAIGTAVGGSVVSGLVTSQASAIISKAVDGDGKTLKITAKIYYHKDKKKYMVESSRGCQKESLTYYATDTGKKYTTGKWFLYSVVNGA